MRIVILPTEVEASNFAAEFIAEFINNNKNPVVGMATGGSVVMTYEALINKHQGIKKTYELASLHAEKAINALSIFENSSIKESLIEVANMSLSRLN